MHHKISLKKNENKKRSLKINIKYLTLLLLNLGIVLLSIFIINIIYSNLFEDYKTYSTSLKLEETDIDKFNYAMKTSVGNVLINGTIHSVDNITFDEIEGEYMYIEKITEEHNLHSRLVTTTVNGRSHTKIEYYYSWDEEDIEKLYSKEIEFMENKFNAEDIKIYNYLNTHTLYNIEDHLTKEFLNSNNYYKLENEYVYTDSDVRYYYKYIPVDVPGSLFAYAGSDTIENVKFYENKIPSEVVDGLESRVAIITLIVTIIFIILISIFNVLYIKYIINGG